MKKKRCPKCSSDLVLRSFDRNSAANDGLQTWCRECRRKHNEMKSTENKAKWSKQSPYES